MAMAPAYHESLPYIDNEPSPSALEAAHALIKAEQLTTPPPTLPPLKPSTLTPTFSPELDRIAHKQPLAALSLSRYEETSPPTDGTSLAPALQNAYTSHTYLSLRQDNLALLETHGKHAWLVSNYHVEGELKRLEAELEDARREIDVVNLERKKRQEEVGEEMRLLEDKWKKGIGKVLETEVAVEEVRAKVRDELKRRAAEPQQLTNDGMPS